MGLLPDSKAWGPQARGPYVPHTTGPLTRSLLVSIFGNLLHWVQKAGYRGEAHLSGRKRWTAQAHVASLYVINFCRPSVSASASSQSGTRIMWWGRRGALAWTPLTWMVPRSTDQVRPPGDAAIPKGPSGPPTCSRRCRALFARVDGPRRPPNLPL